MSNVHYELEDGSTSWMERIRVRLRYLGSARYGGDWHSTLHTHACTELFYVAGGQGQFKIGDQLHAVSADDLVVVSPNVEHTEVGLNGVPLEYIVLGVDGLELDLGEREYAVVSCRGRREEYLAPLREMLRELEEKEPGYQNVCQALLEVLQVRLARQADLNMKAVPLRNRGSRECAAVRRYIDEHFKENITLDLLAEFAHVNKFHMVHSFSKEYGVSPISYLISRRIQESKYLLGGTDHSMSQISHMLGFSSPSYFSQSFRRMEGVSPMEYRRSCRAGE